MRSDFFVVACVGDQQPAQVSLAEDDRVVQALAANGPNQSFGKTVLPRRARCNGFVANAHRTQAMPYDRAKDAVPIADQIVRCRIPRERFRDLPRNPLRRRAPRNGCPYECSAIKSDNHESIEKAESLTDARMSSADLVHRYGLGLSLW